MLSYSLPFDVELVAIPALLCPYIYWQNSARLVFSSLVSAWNAR
jgi:hypothetical protein